ncbi:MAG: ribonuclease HII [Actinomycetaceae bacterium]|nr:ribonuclease HII [Actinomycetaceae bacterium]
MSDGPVIGMDEVGRGALAGPVAVGACVSPLVRLDHERAMEGMPKGLADSKYLTDRARLAIAQEVARWARPVAIGFASAAEIDTYGINSALQLAGIRALEAIAGGGTIPATILLDGSYDWLTPTDQLLDDNDITARFAALHNPTVVTRVKADATSCVVAAASVIAKVSRDHLLKTIPDPGYGWAAHKGYSAATHRHAIDALGPHPMHRLTWKLTPTSGKSSAGRGMMRQ